MELIPTHSTGELVSTRKPASTFIQSSPSSPASLTITEGGKVVRRIKCNPEVLGALLTHTDTVVSLQNARCMDNVQRLKFLDLDEPHNLQLAPYISSYLVPSNVDVIAGDHAVIV